METMAEWYGLKDGHQDFMIESESSANLLFARTELDERLKRLLRRSFRTDSPPKFVLWGDWGVGKTHVMQHVKYAIEHDVNFTAVALYVELPDINQKSTFQVAHSALLDALGLDRAKNWMVQFQSRHGSDSLDLLQEQTQSGDIAKAFSTLIGYGEASRIAWDWLRGLRLSSVEARSVGLPPYLEQSLHMVHVLFVLGRLCREVEGEMLIFMLDEANKVKNVSNGDAINHWLNSFKALADAQSKEVGLILAATFRDQDEMPTPLSDRQVVTRFGESNYIMLENFGEEQTRDFVRGLLLEWIDSDKREEKVTAYLEESGEEVVEAESYPFTSAGLTQFVELACMDGGYSTPRDIQKHLDNILSRAMDDGRHLLSREYVDLYAGDA